MGKGLFLNDEGNLVNFEYWKAWQATPPKTPESANYILKELLRDCGSFSF
jgi:hypothetical protein